MTFNDLTTTLGFILDGLNHDLRSFYCDKPSVNIFETPAKVVIVLREIYWHLMNNCTFSRNKYFQ